MLSCHQLTGIGEVQPGDDLAILLAGALETLVPQAGDVLVVTQKIVSKSENRFVELAGVTAGAAAIRLAQVTHKDPRLVELILAESSAVLRAAPNVLITRHHSGHVMANAGIDQSNTGPGPAGRVTLLPADADATAAALLAGLHEAGVKLRGIVISDSFGRPWRLGVVNAAIGAAGLPVLADRRGDLDRDGRALEVTQVALADMIAAAAGLVMGEGAESVPAVLVRGLTLPQGAAPAAALVRPLREDLFQ